MQNSAPDSHILNLLRFTQTHQRHIDALAKATGEHFNVFNILRVGHYEVKTHSPMLAELLNPKGSHGQGAIFLRLFLKQFDMPDFDSDSESVKLAFEYNIGQITDKSGGRIDIVVRDGKGAAIYIENKIYASDQPNQLQRYRNDDPQAHLFYLTLQGDMPLGFSEESFKKIGCRRISYAEDILQWLDECRKEAACLPGVRETITQYIHLIKKLTNQSINKFMNKDLIDEIIRDKENYAAFYTLCEQFEPVRTALIGRLDMQLLC